MRNKRRLALALALVAAFLSSKAWADSIQITLIPTSQTTVVGGTVTFFAILTNLTNTTQFLNGDSATTSSTFLSVNDASFFCQCAAVSRAGSQHQSDSVV